MLVALTKRKLVDWMMARATEAVSKRKIIGKVDLSVLALASLIAFAL